MSQNHQYTITINWTGNKGQGTSDYREYDRSHTVSIDGKENIFCSSDPAFRGDKTKHNPEELLVASIAGCHMLWYLHLCAQAGIVVVDYADNAVGTMVETENGCGHFTQIILQPTITLINETMIAKADELHLEANKFCFIANSVKFPVFHNAIYEIEYK